MSRLLIQDDIIDGMDVYIEYTFDRADQEEIILYDFGLELTRASNDRPFYTSLKGFIETRWMEDKVIDAIKYEHGMGEYNGRIS